MSNELFKISEDFYVLWYDEGPGVWGTREEVEKTMIEWETEQAVERIKLDTSQRFDRANSTGRSSRISQTPVTEETFTHYCSISKRTYEIPYSKVIEFLDSWNNNTLQFDFNLS